MATLKRCKYCLKQVSEDEVEVYVCDTCSEASHLACVSSQKPSQLKGDTLFIFECRDCSFEQTDIFTRMKLSWVQAIHLSLYNLTVSESGRQGYFRWKEDICAFIENNWAYLMPDREKTATWSSTIAGVLSIHSKLFKSGYHLFHEHGWWALQDVTIPSANPDHYKNCKAAPHFQTCSSVAKKRGESSISNNEYGRGKRQRKGKKRENMHAKLSKLEIGKTHPINGHHGHEKNENSNQTTNSRQINLIQIKVKSEEEKFDFFMSDDLKNTDDNVKLDGDLNTPGSESAVKIEPACDDKEITNIFNNNYDVDNPLLQENINFASDDNPFCLPFLPEDMSDYHPTLFHETGMDDVDEEMTSVNMFPSENENLENVLPPEEEHEEKGSKHGNVSKKIIVPLTVKEELEFLNQINESPLVLNADSSVRRLRRKLLLRKTKRQSNQKLFSLKDICIKFALQQAPNNVEITKTLTEKKESSNSASVGGNDYSKRSYHHPALCDINVLDRFFCFRDSVESETKHKSVHVRLVGDSEETICYRSIISPYTSRVLKPYIRRDFHSVPCKLKLLREIKQRYYKEDSRCKWPIDYCYVQPSHVPAVNALCSDFFWPGIDMTECLQYPEFSCVVLYRKLVIGFAFMVPDVKYNEAYISFILVHPDWQRAGIGSNILYHLIQTCMGKDITLHVSPTNPSMMLYQKFGFKSEKLILGFYDKYLPENSKTCPHALLLRLRR